MNPNLTLEVNGKKLALDHGRGDFSYVSHAHSDHLRGVKRKKELLTNKETLELAKLKSKIIKLKNTKFYNAGHILGSTQLFLEDNSILYTGDIRTKDSLLFKGADVVNAEHLIIETTFAKPYFKFPDYWDVYREIEKWVKKSEDSFLLIGAYNLGKAQEINKLLNEIGIVPIITKEAAYFNKIYKKYGIKLEWIEANGSIKESNVSIVPMRMAKKSIAKELENIYNKKVKVAVASGWAKIIKFKVDKTFVLSDHADFYDLANFIFQVEPKTISYVHGDGKRLHEYVKKKLPNLKMK